MVDLIEKIRGGSLPADGIDMVDLIDVLERLMEAKAGDTIGDLVLIPKDLYVSKEHYEMLRDIHNSLIGETGGKFVMMPVPADKVLVNKSDLDDVKDKHGFTKRFWREEAIKNRKELDKIKGNLLTENEIETIQWAFNPKGIEPDLVKKFRALTLKEKL